jgi:hypothetical protein
MLWGKVDSDGILWIYREWPDQSYGEWALPSEKPDGRVGPAQKQGAGRGIDVYSELIWALETQGDAREEIAERYIDPRSAGSETITRDGGITLVDLLAEARDPLYFLPAVGMQVDDRVLQINDMLCWNREEPMVRGKNHPRIMIHEDCRNLIWSMNEWTGQDGQKGASKDPIDALGYMVVMQPQHVNKKEWAKKWNSMSKAGTY